MSSEALRLQPVALERPVDVPACPLCGEAKRTHRHRAANITEWDNRDLVSCDGCGFVYVAPVKPQRFEDLPASLYLNDWAALDLSGYEHLYDMLHDGLLRLAPNLVKPGRTAGNSLLDVGCGPGYFLDLCRARGWAVQGVEPWRALAAWAGKYLKLDVVAARLAEAPLDERAFTVVFAHDTIQFAPDPVAFLRACWRALKPGGVAFLTTPNLACKRAEREGWGWGQIQPIGHVVYFTPETLRRAARLAGFKRLHLDLAGGADGDEQIRLWARRPPEPSVSFADLTAASDDRELPPLDRAALDEAALSDDQRHWRAQGHLIKRGFMPEPLIDAYCRVRERLNEPKGWHSDYPYMQIPEIKDLCLYKPLGDLLEHLIGQPMGMHLNLTGWVSTEREWHQDDYLNPPFVRGHYVAVWFALDRIHPDSGPFEYVPGSHRWPLIRQDKVLERMPDTSATDPLWPVHAERLLTPMFEREIEEGDLPIETFLADKGDVLIWHARLLHRGSLPRRPGAVRKSIISHYSAIRQRPDMPKARQHRGGGWYFVLGDEIPLSSRLRLLARHALRRATGI